MQPCSRTSLARFAIESGRAQLGVCVFPTRFSQLFRNIRTYVVSLRISDSDEVDASPQAQNAFA